MDKLRKSSDMAIDREVITKAKRCIEKDLSNMKKMVDSINQMRVEAAYLESDLVMSIDASTWEDISQLIGISSMKIIDDVDKSD